MSTDVLVLGAGAAGLCAALEARRRGADVLLVAKTPADGPSCTSQSAGYLTACQDDARDELRRQVLTVGGFLNDAALVDAFLADVPECGAYLAALGVDMRRQHVLDGLGYWRIAAPQGLRPGQGLIDPLLHAVRTAGVRVLDHAAALRLLRADGTVIGATVYHPTTDRLIGIAAASTILATGGGAAMWARTTNPATTTGDGLAIAFQAGAGLANIELVSFEYPDLAEVLAHRPDRDRILSRGESHYFLGGVRIDAHGRTDLPGLFAAGEVALSPFGAGRLGGAALAESIVFGRRAGREAADHTATPTTLDPAVLTADARRLDRRRTNTGPPPAEVRHRLGQTLWRHAGLLKDAASLDRAAEDVRDLLDQLPTASARTGEEVLLAEQTHLSCLLALEVIRAAAWRTESRSCFWRTDHRNPDNTHLLVTRGVRLRDGRHEVDITPTAEAADIPPGPTPFAAGCFDYLRP